VRRLIAAMVFGGVFATSLPAAEVVSVYDIRFLGGQHFFDGDVSALSGNISAVISPAVKFNEKWTLVPTYMGNYQGTRDVQELAGGGTLFQDSTGHGVNVKGIYSVSPSWKMKASAGAKTELLRETKDESWGDGLFDYRKYSGGLEAQYSFSDNANARVSYDYYMLAFPNYQSLESAQDPTLTRELVGTDVLNSRNHMVGLGIESPLPGNMKADFNVYYNMRGYGDQPVVNSAGNTTSTDRDDKVTVAGVVLSAPLFMAEGLRLIGELGYTFSMTDSNQNHYDARKTTFLADYYDYSQNTIAPGLIAAIGETPWVVNLGGAWNHRTYDSRPVQNGNGDYLTSKIDITEISAVMGVGYPVTKQLKIRTQATLGWSDSNMEYEKTFKYNYKIANYLLGFSYEY